MDKIFEWPAGCMNLHSAGYEIQMVHYLGTMTRLLFARELTDIDGMVSACTTFWKIRTPMLNTLLQTRPCHPEPCIIQPMPGIRNSLAARLTSPKDARSVSILIGRWEARVLKVQKELVHRNLLATTSGSLPRSVCAEGVGTCQLQTISDQHLRLEQPLAAA